MDDISKDERFAHITKDPRFRTMSKRQRKVKIDKRFQSMFRDKRFKLKYSVDKRGRPVSLTTNENLRKYYELSDESESNSSSDEENEDGSFDKEEELLASLSEKAKSRSGNLETVAKNKQSHSPKEKTAKRKNKSIVEKRVNGKERTLEKSKRKQKASGSVEVSNSEESEQESIITSGSQKHRKCSDITNSNVNESESEESDSDDESSENDEGGNSDLAVGEDAPDYARGEGLIESSTDEDEDDEDDVNEDFDHQWGELDKNVPEADELGHRLAVCNMDWDRIKATDLFVLFNSFKTSKGVIKSVRIYPSEFGLQRMREEEVQGPTELKELAKQVDVGGEEESEDEDGEGNRYHREKLRQYQLNRLKYYYAVVECDSVQTASNIYDECDGKEYESSSARIDLRYIPDGMTFDQSPKSECFALPHVASYKSPSFFTSALCQSKVDLTWDETDQDRVKLTMKKYDKKGEVNEDDFKAYLASDSEDEDQGYGNLIANSDSEDFSDEDKQIEKYKNLLKDLDGPTSAKGNMEMEIEWEPGLKETTEEIIKTKEKTKGQTPWENYLQQKKEKKKQKKAEQKRKRLEKKEEKLEKAFSDDELPEDVNLHDSFFTDLKSSESKKSKRKKLKNKKILTEEEEEKQKKEEAELSLLMLDEKEDGRQHFSLNDLVEKKKKKKKKEKDTNNKTEDDFQVDVNDSRFEAVYKSHLFNIDPSAPEFKKTKGMEIIIREKLKRRKEDGYVDKKSKKVKQVGEVKDGGMKDELMPLKEESLSSLVKSVKAKTQQFQTKKKKKK